MALTLQGLVLASAVTVTLQSIQKVDEAYVRIKVTALLYKKSDGPNCLFQCPLGCHIKLMSIVLTQMFKKEALFLGLLPLGFTFGLHMSDSRQEFVVTGHL